MGREYAHTRAGDAPKSRRSQMFPVLDSRDREHSPWRGLNPEVPSISTPRFHGGGRTLRPRGAATVTTGEDVLEPFT
jgi:hypothetical protein